MPRALLRCLHRVVQSHQIVPAGPATVIATSAVREAANRLSFLDRIYIATGLQIEPIDEAEETRITYLGILPYLRSEPALATGKTIVIEIGGGSTEITNLALLCWVHHRQVDLFMWAISPATGKPIAEPAPGAPPGTPWPGNNGSPWVITRTPRTRWRV